MKRNLTLDAYGANIILSCHFFFCPATFAAPANDAIIDACRYADSATAQATWIPMGGTAPVLTAVADGQNCLRLPCNFEGTKIERASWDRKVNLDLSFCRGIEFKLLCRDPSPVSYFSIYFESGNGWYNATFFPESAGWETIAIDKSTVGIEGKPAGWSQIKTIRISAWRGKDQDTELFLSDIRKTGLLGVDTKIVILRSDFAIQGAPDEARSVKLYSESVAENLATAGIGSSMVSDLDISSGLLKKARLVILPYNPSLPDRVAGLLAEYANAGGKFMFFYIMPEKLQAVTRLSAGRHVRATYPGAFATIGFQANALPGAPKTVGQQSWNINAIQPIPGASRILGEWLDDKGQPTGYPAVLASSNAILMTHVLLPGDPANKRRMLLAMAGLLVPEIWKESVEASLASCGSIGSYKNFDEAVAQIPNLNPNDSRVTGKIAVARQDRDAAVKLLARNAYAEATDAATSAGQSIEQAFCMAQQPLPGEFRAFWCHSAFGVQGLEWDEAIRRLAENGFTAILPNMLWGGAAFYDSKVLPVAADTKSKGDQIQRCVSACRKYGLQIHVWKVNWNLGHAAPQEFVSRMRREKRLQASSRGKEEPWLCPSHPENQKLEIASMVEVARNYDVDGIHFDYIRYPDSDHCFCSGCMARFERASGNSIKNWPAEVLAEGPLHQSWLAWRRDNITVVVKAVSEKARALKPNIKISAAVFRNWPTDRDHVGQDWKLWCDKGYVDFVCPMDYTASTRNFENMVAQQVPWTGKARCYPGIGVSASSSHFGPDRVIEQIQVTRRYNTKGFVIFNYGVAESKDLVPMLGMGITRRANTP